MAKDRNNIKLESESISIFLTKFVTTANVMFTNNPR